MASSSKPKTPEELKKLEQERIAEAKAYQAEKEKRKRMVVGGVDHMGNPHELGSYVYIDDDGYYEDGPDPENRYRMKTKDGGLMSTKGGRIYLADVPAEAKSGGGGGGKGGGGKPPKDKITYPGDQGPTVQTTPESAYPGTAPGGIWETFQPTGGSPQWNPLWDQYDPWKPNPAHGIWNNPGIINTNPKVLI